MDYMKMVGILTNFCGGLALLILVLPFGGLVSALPGEFEWIALVLGHTGAWVLETVVLAVCILRGAFDWIPVKPGFLWALILSVHAVLGLVTMALLPSGTMAFGQMALAAGVPGTVVVYSMMLLNSGLRLRLPAAAVRVPAILTAGVAAALATVSVPVTVETIRDNWRRAEWSLEQTQQRRADWVREERAALGRLRSLGGGAELAQLLPFAVAGWSLAGTEANERIAALPGLPHRLARLLDAGDDGVRQNVAAYIADFYNGASAPLLCGPLSTHLGGLRKRLEAQLTSPWPRSREFYGSASKALEASRKLSSLGCSFNWERDQWMRRLEGAPAGLLRDLLLSKLNATDPDNSKLWTSNLR